jgi:hypothetical protein
VLQREVVPGSAPSKARWRKTHVRAHAAALLARDPMPDLRYQEDFGNPDTVVLLDS